MNATELLAYNQGYNAGLKAGIDLNTEPMLRNQQAEIEFLKKEILEKHEDWKHEGQQAANARAEIGCYKIELELHKAMIQDLENALKNTQTNPLQNKLDVIANRIVFGKAQEK